MHLTKLNKRTYTSPIFWTDTVFYTTFPEYDCELWPIIANSFTCAYTTQYHERDKNACRVIFEILKESTMLSS